MAHEQDLINASPTKQFFIDMLTRDIRLDRAIIDLIDNSIDGAKHIREDENYQGLYVNITANKDVFSIRDNCGGFPLNVAKNYAFRFGRPSEAEFVKHSTGRFGVGMKRALFKIGKKLWVESKHDTDHFLVDINVDEWIREPENMEWGFKYYKGEEIPETKKKLNGEYGTVITVEDLYSEVSNDFSDDNYIVELEKEIGLALSYSLLKGLQINLNNSIIQRKDIDFLVSDKISPYFKEINLDGVNVKIYAGIGKPDPSIVGWYIFCNDRLVLEADTSNITGWRETREDDEAGIVKYNNKHAMFRGVVFFDADDSSKLPMTTTKTGIDTDHPVFKSTKPYIKTALRQVTAFTNKINDREIRQEIVSNSESVRITEIRLTENDYSPLFKGPEIDQEKKEYRYVSICFSKERELVEKVKDYLGVSTNKEVGEKIFDYFMNMKKGEI